MAVTATLPSTGVPRSTAAAGGEALLWPWWSQVATDTVRLLLDEGDMAAAGAGHPLIDACEELAGEVLAPGRRVMLCDSGTAALETAYAALRLDPGSEVLVATHSFRSTVTAMLPQGLVPVLCDTDPATGGIDLDDAAARITPRTAALTITHMWGRPAPLDAVRRLCARHHLAVVADCSHAHGLVWQGQPVGLVGDVTVWSCGTWKMVSGGKAGLLATRDRDVWERALVLGQPKHRALARVRDERLRALAVTGVGHNRRPSPAAAALVADHLRRLRTPWRPNASGRRPWSSSSPSICPRWRRCRNRPAAQRAPCTSGTGAWPPATSWTPWCRRCAHQGCAPGCPPGRSMRRRCSPSPTSPPTWGCPSSCRTPAPSPVRPGCLRGWWRSTPGTCTSLCPTTTPSRTTTR
ncbi:aminotransferase class I/II-fold pyridoxal phosphate-dependent enzyme [Streptomyces sp. DSM 40712]|uniref:Aminotransferase class I/II-fold pyridoxal phosphate-dependent enzyme n=1 Tax=Streptomyces lancefieldiae TaxID=3075520 RepID=A0ABU3AX75_9ACTN|nr:aminotransferase class I/II-fold pyridoxal phosphate-dependent enzyme [Streptomyces sp. DSM 40712]